MSLWSTGYTLFEMLAVLVVGYVMGRVHSARRDPHLRELRRQQAVQDRLTAEERLGRLSPELRDKVDAHLAGGRMIDAVRDVRTTLGCGLKDAKDVVDAASAAHGRSQR